MKNFQVRVYTGQEIVEVQVLKGVLSSHEIGILESGSQSTKYVIIIKAHFTTFGHWFLFRRFQRSIHTLFIDYPGHVVLASLGD